MAQISKKSQKFLAWIRNVFGKEVGVSDVELLLALEESARMVEHEYLLIGEVGLSTLGKLGAAVRALEEAYGKDQAS